MVTSPAIAQRLRGMYRALDSHFGNLGWWPADSPFEVIVGAILTQNTAWQNVTYAIAKLKEAQLLSPQGIYSTPPDTLATLIKSSGYYHVKARRLAAFANYLYDAYGGMLDQMFAQNHWLLRKQLLSVHGIGEETADSILLYAGNKPIFVVDAYTRRIMGRHGLVSENERYESIQALFMDNLQASVPLFNQFHALLVSTAKVFCRKERRCHGCPLSDR